MIQSHQLPAHHNTNNIRTNTSPAGSPQQPNFSRDNYFSSSIHPVINDSDNVAANSDEITLDNKSDLNVVNDNLDDRLGSSHNDVLSNGDQYFENLSESDIFRMSETQANAFKKGAKIELSKAPASADYDGDDVIRMRRDATYSRRQAHPTERKKTTCMLYLQVNNFYQNWKSSK